MSRVDQVPGLPRSGDSSPLTRRRGAIAARPGPTEAARPHPAAGPPLQAFADLLRGAPCILTGVADPTNTQAHSENESLHLGDWVKAMRSTIHLYDALARLPRR